MKKRAKKQSRKIKANEEYKKKRSTCCQNIKLKIKKEVLTEKTLFFICNDESHAIQIAKKGLYCEESEYNYLGDTSRGIHLGKHIDILLKHEYTKRKRSNQLYCVLIKVN